MASEWQAREGVPVGAPLVFLAPTPTRPLGSPFAPCVKSFPNNVLQIANLPKTPFSGYLFTSMPFRHKQLALALLFLAAGRPERLTAQVGWSARLGAGFTSTMITDQLGTQVIKLAPGLSPALSVEGFLPLKTRTPLEATLELQATTGTLRRTEGGAEADLASMRTFAITGGFRGRLMGPVSWRAGAGLVSYATSEKASIFQDGAPTRPLLTAGVEYRRALSPRTTLSGVVRYDVHSFTTKQLESAGYTGTQLVHRVLVGVGVSR